MIYYEDAFMSRANRVQAPYVDYNINNKNIHYKIYDQIQGSYLFFAHQTLTIRYH